MSISKFSFAALVLGASVVAMPAIAAGQGETVSADATASATAATEAKAEEKRVCRPVKSTGSRMARKRICQTAAEWAQTDQAERNGFNRANANRAN